jgi:hypothetical protein
VSVADALGADSKGQQESILNEKFYLSMLNKFRCIEPRKGSSVNNCDLFKAHNVLLGGLAIVITCPRNQKT